MVVLYWFGAILLIISVALAGEEMLPWQYLQVENRLVKKFLTNKYSKSHFNQWRYNLSCIANRFRQELNTEDRREFDEALAELDYDPFSLKGMFK